MNLIDLIKKDGGKSHTVKLTRYLDQKKVRSH